MGASPGYGRLCRALHIVSARDRYAPTVVWLGGLAPGSGGPSVRIQRRRACSRESSQLPLDGRHSWVGSRRHFRIVIEAPLVIDLLRADCSALVNIAEDRFTLVHGFAHPRAVLLFLQIDDLRVAGHLKPPLDLCIGHLWRRCAGSDGVRAWSFGRIPRLRCGTSRGRGWSDGGLPAASPVAALGGGLSGEEGVGGSLPQADKGLHSSLSFIQTRTDARAHHRRERTVPVENVGLMLERDRCVALTPIPSAQARRENPGERDRQEQVANNYCWYQRDSVSRQRWNRHRNGVHHRVDECGDGNSGQQVILRK
jgi:hypothetical protein